MRANANEPVGSEYRCLLVFDECVPAGQRVRGLDHRVLLLPSGRVSDDKRGEAPDEDSDLSRDHGPRVLLRTPPGQEQETGGRSGEILTPSCNTGWRVTLAVYLMNHC